MRLLQARSGQSSPEGRGLGCRRSPGEKDHRAGCTLPVGPVTWRPVTCSRDRTSGAEGSRCPGHATFGEQRTVKLLWLPAMQRPGWAGSRQKPSSPAHAAWRAARALRTQDELRGLADITGRTTEVGSRQEAILVRRRHPASGPSSTTPTLWGCDAPPCLDPQSVSGTEPSTSVPSTNSISSSKSPTSPSLSPWPTGRFHSTTDARVSVTGQRSAGGKWQPGLCRGLGPDDRRQCWGQRGQHLCVASL